MSSAKKDDVTIIKKYANRRLYDTGRSSYVTLDDLSEMVREGHNFVVQDAKSGKDITRSVLAQIILDQEANNEDEGTLMPTNFMRTLIGFYGGNMQKCVPNYLEKSMELFAKNQEYMQEHINKSLKSMPSMNGMNNMQSMPSMKPAQAMIEEMNKQNMAMIERTFQMMSAFNPALNQEQSSSKK